MSVLNSATTAGVGGLFHNVLYSFNIIDNTSATEGVLPIQGVGDTNRNGSDIYCTGFMIRGQVNLPFDRRNTKIKMWLCERSTTDGSPNSYTQWFKSITGSGALDPVDNDRFKVKSLGELRATARDLYVERGELTDAGAESTIYFKKWIPYKRKLKFPSGSSNVCTGMKEALSVHFLAYDTYNAAETDRVVTALNCAVTCYFKDP